MVFFNFFNFFAISLEFSISRLAGTKRNDNFYFSSFSSFSNLFLAWNEAVMVFFNLFNFFAIYLEFSISRLVGTKRKNNFYFPSFSAFYHLFWLKMKPWWYLLIFWIFLLFCWNFQLRDGQERNVMIIFFFSLSHPFPTYFG